MSPHLILGQLKLDCARLSAQKDEVDRGLRLLRKAMRKERIRRGITLKAFAEKLGYTSAMVAMLESGKRRWSLGKAEKAVRLLRHPMWPDCPVGIR